MELGITMVPADYAMDVVELAREVEARGFESLWFPEHTHIPVAMRTPWPGPGKIPDEYKHALDPFVAFGAIASATTRIKLGTGICLVIQRDPIVLAREVSALDYLSNGRFLFGIGAGWNHEEIENHGVPYAKRWRVMRERVRAMKTIWTNDEAEFHGEFVDFGPLWQWPKPVQKPHPPVIVGGDGPMGIDHMVEYGDGWLPHPNRPEGPLEERIALANRKLEEAGRGPVPITVFGALGDAAELELNRALGVARTVFRLPPRPRDEALPILDRYAAMLERFRS
jgi:probable F420-dependent oxidoreductase